LKPPKLEFGFSVSVDVNTIVIGAPGHGNPNYNNLPTGAVFVYDRLNLLDHFDYRQVCYCCVMTRVDDVARALLGRATRPLRSSRCYSWSTPCLVFPCCFPLLSNGCSCASFSRTILDVAVTAAPCEQTLYGTTSVPFDRFGHGVAVQGNTIVVSSSANYSGTVAGLHPRFEVQQVRSSTTARTALLARTFRLGFRRVFAKAPRGADERGDAGVGVRDAAGGWEPVMSRPIPYDASEPLLREILEADLGTGRVLVNRFGPTVNRGYRWLITFSGQGEGVTLPLLDVSGGACGGG
jgi:hypothetical protein